VIGYDILTHLWPRYHDTNTSAKSCPEYSALEKLESFVGSVNSGNVKEYQEAQSDYLRELQTQGNTWRVSDFITLGSPLAHASLLMSRNAEEFLRKKGEREFPTSPPVLENVKIEGAKERGFVYSQNGIRVPHHAAIFAPTRWTNLYFPCRLTIGGDVVGGPLSPSFGAGIRDVKVYTDLRWGLFTHTLYWSRRKNAQEGMSWIDELRKALRLTSGESSTSKSPAESENAK
jgi:hypothetical protein